MLWILHLEVVDQEPWWLLFTTIYCHWDCLISRGSDSSIRLVLIKPITCIHSCRQSFITVRSSTIQSSILDSLSMINTLSRSTSYWVIMILIMLVLSYKPLIHNSWLMNSFMKLERVWKSMERIIIVVLWLLINPIVNPDVMIRWTQIVNLLNTTLLYNIVNLILQMDHSD